VLRKVLEAMTASVAAGKLRLLLFKFF